MSPDLVWTASPSEVGAALADVGHAESLKANRQRFPLRTARDYTDALRRVGILGPHDDLSKRLDLVAASQAHWHASGGDACLFAADLSARRHDIGWNTIVLAARSDVDEDAAAIAAHTASHIADPRSEILSVVLPRVADAWAVARLTTALAAHTGWSLDEIGTEHDCALGDLVLLGLRVALAVGVRSEILGFGPIVTFPHTRRGPFIELAIRVGLGAHRKEHHRGNIADIPLDVASKVMCDLLTRTRTSREQRLPPAQNERAKAKVTFTVPAAVWVA